MSEPALKGALFNNGIKAIRDIAGEGAFLALLPELTKEARRLVQDPPAASVWVPIRWRHEIFELAFARLFAGDLTKMYEVGWAAHTGTFKTVYRMFIKLLAPKFLLSRVKPAWQATVLGCGTLEKRMEGDASLEIEYRDHPRPAPWYWEYNRGGMAGLCALTHVKNARATIVSGGGTQSHCAIRVEWDR